MGRHVKLNVRHAITKLEDVLNENNASIRHELLLHYAKMRHSTKICHVYACTKNPELVKYI